MTDRTNFDSRRATLEEIMNVLKNEPDSTELVTDSGHFQGLIKQARADERAEVLSEVEKWLDGRENIISSCGYGYCNDSIRSELDELREKLAEIREDK